MRHSVEAEEAARRINEAFRGKRMFSDAPSYGGKWLRRLFDAADARPEFAIEDLDSLVLSALEARRLTMEEALEMLDRIQERAYAACPCRHRGRHRAEADALAMAASARAALDPAFLASPDGRLPAEDASGNPPPGKGGRQP